MNQQRLTLSTAISLSRILLLAPITYLLVVEGPDYRWWAVGLLLLAVATDFLDGYLARRLHQVTDLGKIIDPVADKIGVAVVAVVLIVSGDIPLWYGAAVLGRDALISLGGLYIRLQKRIIPQSNWPGKIAVSLVAVYLILSVAREASLETIRTVLLWASVAVMAVSLFSYGRRLFIGRSVKG